MLKRLSTFRNKRHENIFGYHTIQQSQRMNPQSYWYHWNVFTAPIRVLIALRLLGLERKCVNLLTLLQDKLWGAVYTHWSTALWGHHGIYGAMKALFHMFYKEQYSRNSPWAEKPDFKTNSVNGNPFPLLWTIFHEMMRHRRFYRKLKLFNGYWYFQSRDLANKRMSFRVLLPTAYPRPLSVLNHNSQCIKVI